MKKIKVGKNKFALVDDADYDWLNQWKWYLQITTSAHYQTYYAARFENGKSIRMHRLILGLTNPKILCDHIDHDGLNNQRYNLRQCTARENGLNKSPHGTSKYLGVSWHKTKNIWTTRKGKKESEYRPKGWIAHINVNGKALHLGLFQDDKQAALAYNEAAKKYYGEFANLNKV